MAPKLSQERRHGYEGRAEQLGRCDQELNEWFEHLKTAVRPAKISSVSNAGSHSCSEVHWAVLNLTYQTTVNVLNRTSALQTGLHDSSNLAVQSPSRSKVKRSARELTKLSLSMLRQDQLRFLGLIGVTAIIAAYLSHVLDITSVTDDDDDARDASTFRLYQSLEVLQSFRGIYASADAAVSFLASVSKKAGILIPVQADEKDMEESDQTRASQAQQGQASQMIRQAGPYNAEVSNAQQLRPAISVKERMPLRNGLTAQSPDQSASAVSYSSRL